MSKIVIVKGSPRREGNSAILAEELAEGARSVGAQVESFYLHHMDINPCDACDACHSEPYRGCIVDDDMQILYPKLVEADAIVIVVSEETGAISIAFNGHLRTMGNIDQFRQQLKVLLPPEPALARGAALLLCGALPGWCAAGVPLPV